MGSTLKIYQIQYITTEVNITKGPVLLVNNYYLVNYWACRNDLPVFYIFLLKLIRLIPVKKITK